MSLAVTRSVHKKLRMVSLGSCCSRLCSGRTAEDQLQSDLGLPTSLRKPFAGKV